MTHPTRNKNLTLLESVPPSNKVIDDGVMKFLFVCMKEFRTIKPNLLSSKKIEGNLLQELEQVELDHIHLLVWSTLVSASL
jgi:hypothetical protein